jgi:hypothetical protein
MSPTKDEETTGVATAARNIYQQRYNAINNTKRIALFVSNKSVNIPRQGCRAHNEGHAST